jgi:hypothetical protein
MALDLSAYLTEIKNDNPRLGVALQAIQDAINQTAIATGTDSTQHIAPPDPPQGINVALGSANDVHVTIQDNSQRSRALRYFLEWSVDDPNFLAPHVEDLGVSRGKLFSLAKSGSNGPHSYYFRAYSSYLSSKTASEKTYYGGSISPTPVTPNGGGVTDFLPSTGAGTESSNGQAGGNGFGRPQFAQPRAGSPVLP